jgi:uncharacterized protein (TIGR03382 family)
VVSTLLQLQEPGQVEMRYDNVVVPEPAASASALAALCMLGVLARRRS